MALNTPLNSWSMIGVSIGWDGTDNNGGMACIYTFGTAELFNCFYNIAINYESDLSNSSLYTFEFLQGSSGIVTEVYIEEYFKVPEEFSKFASLRGSLKIDHKRATKTTASPKCPARIATECGNMLLDAGEQCDDGNIAISDGCGSTCAIELAFECSKNKYGYSTCVPPCGSGVKITSRGEMCDDGNLINLDGCSSTCQLEDKYTCTTTENE